MTADRRGSHWCVGGAWAKGSIVEEKALETDNLARVLSAEREEILRCPIPGPSPVASVLAFSLFKAGSTLLRRLLIDLTPHAGVELFDIEARLFRQGIDHKQLPPSVSEVFLESGVCYGVFRTMPWRYEIPIFERAPKVLLVRDPRDMLVSHYFSIRKSHHAPGTGKNNTRRDRFEQERSRAQSASIDEHAIRNATLFLGFFETYAERLHPAPGLMVDRYEDIIFEKQVWVERVCEHFGWEIPADVREEIVQRHDIRPDEECDDKHIRRVTPGDHVQKLRPETISALNEVFGEVLDRYGYER